MYYIIIILILEVLIDLIRVIVVVHDYTNILIDVKIHWDLIESHQSVRSILHWTRNFSDFYEARNGKSANSEAVEMLRTLESFFLPIILAILTSYQDLCERPLIMLFWVLDVPKIMFVVENGYSII